MLYQELPRIDSTPLDGWGRWLVPAVVGAAAVTAAVLLILYGLPLVGGAAILAGIGGIAAVLRKSGGGNRMRIRSKSGRTIRSSDRRLASAAIQWR